jgi:hypothetical protein
MIMPEDEEMEKIFIIFSKIRYNNTQFSGVVSWRPSDEKLDELSELAILNNLEKKPWKIL